MISLISLHPDAAKNAQELFDCLMMNMKIRMASNQDPIFEMHKKQKKLVYHGNVGSMRSEGDVQDIALLVRGKEPVPLLQRVGLGQSLLTKTDRRTEVSNPSAAPWRMICSLEVIDAYGESYIGTGWIAGPRLIMTAGHCVFEKDRMQGWAKSIKIYPGRSSATDPADCYVSTQFRAPEQWVSKCDENFDYGAIILDEDIGLKYGYFTSSTYSDFDLKTQMVNISGYPGSKVGETQLHHQNRINSVSPTKIYYDIDTEGGQSGSPIWLYEEGNDAPIVVGIHAYGAGAVIPGNSGVRINEEILEFIEKWREF